MDRDHEIRSMAWLGEQGMSRGYASLARCFCLVCLAITVAFLVFATQMSAHFKSIDQCGTTASEAIAKGCIFETTGFSWLPPDCVDSEVESEFLEEDIPFYKDENYTQLATLDEVQSGRGHGFFVRHEYHTAHCAFLLKKLHRAYASGGKLDGLVVSTHHTDHCVHMLLNPPEDVWTTPAFAFTKFPYCGRKGGFNIEWGRQGEWTD